MKPQDKIGPSSFHMRGGGFLDLRNPDEELWFKTHLGQGSAMILSYLERRWLFEGFATFNIIEGKYLHLDRRSIGFGAFANSRGNRAGIQFLTDSLSFDQTKESKQIYPSDAEECIKSISHFNIMNIGHKLNPEPSKSFSFPNRSHHKAR